MPELLDARRRRLVVASRTTSLAGDLVLGIALQLLVFHSTGSAAATTLVAAVGVVPRLVMSVPAGLLADRVDRRFLAVCTDAASLLSLVPLLWSRDVVLVVVVSGVLSALSAAFQPAFAAWVPELGSLDQVQELYASMAVGANAVTLLAAPLGAVLMQRVGTTWLVAADMASFVLAASLLVLVPPGSAHLRLGVRPPTRDQLRESFGLLARNPLLRAVTALNTASALLGSAVGLLLVPLLLGELHVDANRLAALVVVSNGSGLAASLVARRLGRSQPLGRRLLVGSFGSALLSAGMGLAQDLLQVCVVVALSALVQVVLGTALSVVTAQATPSELMGRVTGSVQLMTTSAALLGSLLAPALVVTVGVRSALLGIAPVMLLASLAATRSVRRALPTSGS